MVLYYHCVIPQCSDCAMEENNTKTDSNRGIGFGGGSGIHSKTIPFFFFKNTFFPVHIRM